MDRANILFEVATIQERSEQNEARLLDLIALLEETPEDDEVSMGYLAQRTNELQTIAAQDHHKLVTLARLLIEPRKS